MSPAGQVPRPLRFVPARRPARGPLSPIESLSFAWLETIALLFRPFSGRRWIKLSAVCLFLGGGTSTAAFQWGFGSLPVEVHASDALLRVRQIIAGHPSLIILAVALSLGLVLSLLYVRCVLRFVLVDAVIKQEVAFGLAWKNLEPAGRAYFFWLLGVAAALLVSASAATLWSYLYISSGVAPGRPAWLATLLLVAILAAVVLAGLMVAVVITLTDDLVVPVMYAERISLPAAWEKVWKVARGDAVMFVLYLVLRFAVSMGIGVAVLFFLFPVLMGLSSGTLLAAALVVLVLRLLGLAWTWNPLTIILAALALIIFTCALFAVLSAVGMPGQVYLQKNGIRFIASRTPALEALCRASAASGWRH